MLKLKLKRFLKKFFRIIWVTIKFTIESYIIFFRYLFTNFIWDLISVLKFLSTVLLWISGILLRFTIRRLITLTFFLIDCKKVLPFLFKRPDVFMKYSMSLKRVEKRKHVRRRTRFINLYCFFLLAAFSLFFYDIADEETVLILYEFHKWW